MTKIISAIVICAMIAHMIRPFGLPGMRRRGDVWKLALVAFAVIALVTAIRPE
ncbi:hypothetical protein RDV64_13200 [Acuticoccus sp. MNP-M23]|uniref:hypothetical protein n=1 Tax=Acuticoccus sp. MNP-M23 TaxID=3072793 RepID=UPI002814E494|nr:hypothetical protein [Acuticoccus sp. MNP-M23]WMS41042.1 hypothetical protein RDV64_13200 [Acuticoccus sp. MNP-M23]